MLVPRWPTSEQPHDKPVSQAEVLVTQCCILWDGYHIRIVLLQSQHPLWVFLFVTYGEFSTCFLDL